MSNDKFITPSTIEHQNNLIINNSTNANHNKENDLMVGGSDISIISADQDHDDEFSKAMMATSASPSSQTTTPPTMMTANNNYDPKASKQNEMTKNVENAKYHQQQANNDDPKHNGTGPSNPAASQVDTEKKRTIPINIIMGIIQIILSVTIVALGCLVLARESTLSNAGAGLWAGAMAAIAGCLGIINIPRAQTAFLAVSLVCVATSTLALAFTGIGVVRDSNITDQQKSLSAVTAGSGLLFALIAHFFISVFSVYHSTLKLCTRQLSPRDDQEYTMAIPPSLLSQKKVEEYIKSMAAQQKQAFYATPTIISNEKGGGSGVHSLKRHQPYPEKQHGSWMGGMDTMSNVTYPGPYQGQYPVMLIPAVNNSNKMHMVPFIPPSYLPQPAPFLPHHEMGRPPMSYDMFYHNQTMQRKQAKHQQRQREERQSLKQKRRMRRRKSEGDVLANDREALQYHGLDRAIAEDFLVKQEQNNNLHHTANNMMAHDDGRGDVAL